MKKIIGFAFGLLLLFSFLKNVSAQSSTNTFNCGWTGIQCAPGSNDCAAGFEPNESACSATDMSSCQGIINQPCKRVSTATRFSCQSSFSGGCAPDDNGPYTSFTACQSACTGQTPTKFSCKAGQCVEDQNGPYSGLGNCASACSSESNGIFCPGDKTGINTAIGCIHILGEGGPDQFLGELLKWAVGIGGGIAFLLIVYASFMIMTSSGNPERLKAGQELLTSAISGLILLVLSIFVLKFIGVDILGLDRFGFNQ